MEFSRLKLSRFVRIITGHNNLLYHRSNIDPDLNPMCRFCREKQETFLHFISDCPALWKERQEIFLSPLPVKMKEDWKPDDMVDFSFCKRITEALDSDEVIGEDFTDDHSTSDVSEEEGREDSDMDTEEEDPDNSTSAGAHHVESQMEVDDDGGMTEEMDT